MTDPEDQGQRDDSVLFQPETASPGSPSISAQSEPSPGKGRRSKRSQAPKERRPLLWRTAIIYHKLHLPPVRSRRGIALIVLLIASAGAVVTMVGLKAAGYSESAAFCTKCHQMGPEMRAYQTSAHSELPCADCHVAPGVTGWLKAKIRGSVQLFQVVTHTFPTPIPPPEHEKLPPVQDTCLKCHSLDKISANGGPIRLVLRPTYLPDASNTQQMIAVVLRPQGIAGGSEVAQASTDSDSAANPRGVHWHVELQVTYLSSDPRTQTIDEVTVRNANGTTSTFISAAKVTMTGNANPDLARLNASESRRTMDCLDCHNRAGHGNPTPSQAVDSAISNGEISESIPYIKKNAVTLLGQDFATLEAADAAFDALVPMYQKDYPAFSAKNLAAIETAVTKLKDIYHQLATPDMKVYANTYPDNLGHQSSPGCFRCHDGAHYKVVNGQVTGETIPSTCSTCHTFPQVGGALTAIQLGAAPSSHKDPLWVFNHRYAAAAIASAQNAAFRHLGPATVDPVGTTCGTCHQRTFCEGCHKSGAISISHQAMLFDHASVVHQLGSTTACATCHQPAQCAVCHKGQVLPSGATGLALYTK